MTRALSDLKGSAPARTAAWEAPAKLRLPSAASEGTA